MSSTLAWHPWAFLGVSPVFGPVPEEEVVVDVDGVDGAAMQAGLEMVMTCLTLPSAAG